MSTEEYEIYHNYPDWSKNIKQYEHDKKNLLWGANPKPTIITHKIMKERENIFNPISQKYYNDSYNETLKSKEREFQISEASKNYDKALRNEQTYNIVNLKDKLLGFELHADYPKYKDDIKKKKLESSNATYNIISTISLDKHNYLPPEKRPKFQEESNEIKPHKVNAQNYKDYDIISNKYRINHEAKSKADYDISRINAAKNYWKTHDFDFIQNRYLDENKEAQYQKMKIEDAQKKSLTHQEKE
jgi:hypothetical protein